MKTIVFIHVLQSREYSRVQEGTEEKEDREHVVTQRHLSNSVIIDKLNVAIRKLVYTASIKNILGKGLQCLRDGHCMTTAIR